MTEARFPRWLAAAFLALYAAWALIVPVYEAPDEPAHWQYARYLHDHWALPRFAAGFEEANSPPLAYLLFAPLAREAGSPAIALGVSPEGRLASIAPPRTFLNTDQDWERYWPIRFARLLAAIISVGTVLLTWRAGLAARDRTTGLLAALIVGLLPQFAFRGANVSNDALVTCASAAVTWGMVCLVREPFTWRVAWATSAALAAAYLSKISAIALVPAVGLALLLAQPAAGPVTRVWRLGALALAAAIVAPWSMRNVVLYGDPFASGAMREAVAHIITDRPLLSGYFVGEFPRTLAYSFVGMFGWLTVVLPKWLSRAYLVFFAAAGAGVVIGALRRRIDWRLAAVLALAGIGTLAVVVRINLEFTQAQGRYLFPALPAFGILVALGLQSLGSAVARAATPLRVGVVLAAANVGILAGVVWPAYYPAPARTLASGERRVVPGGVFTDLAIVDADGGFLVTGPNPSWLGAVGAPSETFDAFTVELTASATPAARRGCVSFAMETGALARWVPICFDWTADGVPHPIRVDLRGHEGWAGRITHLRLDPFAEGTGPPKTPVRAREPRLVPAGTR